MKDNNYFGYIYKTKIKNKDSRLYNHFYIGKKIGTVENTETYFGSGIILQDYCHKHGNHSSKYVSKDVAEKLKLEKIILDYAYSEEELNILEKKYIKKYKNNKFCLNLTDGGDGHSGIPWNKGLTKETNEVIAKIANQKTGENSHFYGSEPWNKGLKYSSSQKRKISKATKEAMSKLPQDKKDKMKSKVGHKGIVHTAETKAKISKTKSGKKYSTIDGRRVWNTDIPYINKQVFCKNDNKEFLNVVEAANYYKISTGSIISSCRDNTKYVLINDQHVYFIFI